MLESQELKQTATLEDGTAACQLYFGSSIGHVSRGSIASVHFSEGYRSRNCLAVYLLSLYEQLIRLQELDAYLLCHGLKLNGLNLLLPLLLSSAAAYTQRAQRTRNFS